MSDARHAQPDRHRPVVLVGPPASGKSTLGRLLAARRGAAFADTDAWVEADAGGTSVAALFAREGEKARYSASFTRGYWRMRLIIVMA